MIIKNALVESVNLNSELNVKITANEDNCFYYNFKQKGTKSSSHMFMKLKGDEKFLVEIFDKNEKITREVE